MSSAPLEMCVIFKLAKILGLQHPIAELTISAASRSSVISLFVSRGGVSKVLNASSAMAELLITTPLGECSTILTASLGSPSSKMIERVIYLPNLSVFLPQYIRNALSVVFG